MKISKLSVLATIIFASLSSTALAQTATVELSQLVPADTDIYMELNTGAPNPFNGLINWMVTENLSNSGSQLTPAEQKILQDVLANELKNNKLTMAIKYKTVTVDDGSYTYQTSDAYMSVHVTAEDLKKLSVLGRNNSSTFGSSENFIMVGDLVVISNEPANLSAALDMYNKRTGTSLAQYPAFINSRQKDLPGSFLNIYLNAKSVMEGSFVKTETFSLAQTTSGFNFSAFVQFDENKFSQMNVDLSVNSFIPELYKWVNSKNILFFVEESNLQAKIENSMKLNFTGPEMTQMLSQLKTSLKTEANIDWDAEVVPLLKNQYSLAIHQSGQVYPAVTFMLNWSGDLNAENHNSEDTVAKGTALLGKLLDYVDKSFVKMETAANVDFYNRTSTTFNGTAFYQMTFDPTKFPNTDPALKNLPKEKVLITVNAGITREGVLIITTAPNPTDVYTTDKIGMMNNVTFKNNFNNPQEVVSSLNYANFDGIRGYVANLMNNLGSPQEASKLADGLLAPWHEGFARMYSTNNSATINGFVNVDVNGLAKYGDLFNGYFSTLPSESDFGDFNQEPPFITELDLTNMPQELPMFSPVMNMMEDARFCDVHQSDWYSKYVNDLADNNIVKGYEDGCFHPGRQITRAEFVKMMMMASGMEPEIMTTSSFRDVTTQMQWYDNYVNTAASKGFIHGYNDGTFRPNAPITRAEALQLLYNMSRTIRQVNDLGAPVSSIISFKDVGANDWYMPAVAGAYHAGLVQGDGNHMFNPNRNLTRAEAAKIIKLYWAIMKEEGSTWSMPTLMTPMAAPVGPTAPVMPSLSPTPMYPTTPVQQ